ncbi:MAG: hypothetical protein LBD70_08235, partial [Bifidobacteriaceae bacterium]|nr:hypothetical protein [Bifidobacteriaceae bacterium]
MRYGDWVADGKKQGGGISVIQVLASALAAVTSTVALSYLGVTGTILGAALASIITVVGNFIYSRSLARTHKAVKTLAQQAVTMVLPTVQSSDGAETVDDAVGSGSAGATGQPQGALAAGSEPAAGADGRTGLAAGPDGGSGGSA